MAKAPKSLEISLVEGAEAQVSVCLGKKEIGTITPKNGSFQITYDSGKIEDVSSFDQALEHVIASWHLFH